MITEIFFACGPCDEGREVSIDGRKVSCAMLGFRPSVDVIAWRAKLPEQRAERASAREAARRAAIRPGDAQREVPLPWGRGKGRGGE